MSGRALTSIITLYEELSLAFKHFIRFQIYFARRNQEIDRRSGSYYYMIRSSQL
jgi:hypothetical protein